MDKLTINELGQEVLITLLQTDLELERDSPNLDWIKERINIAINSTRGVVGMTQINTIEEWSDGEEIETNEERNAEDEGRISSESPQ